MKLRVVKRYNPHYSTSPVIGSAVNTSALGVTKTTDYVGSKVFENNALKRILVDGGYIENGAYYFYIPDHLGNNRVVVNQAGISLQNTDYYPFGKPMQHSTSAGVQPNKFGGKEYDTMHGLDWYDFEARMLGTDIPVFPTQDPLAEKYYSISPYAYCGDNPVNAVDPDGRSILALQDVYNVDPSSRRVYVTKTDDPYDIVLVNGKNPVTLPKGQVSEGYYEKIGYSVWPANPVGMGATDWGLSLFVGFIKIFPYIDNLITKANKEDIDRFINKILEGAIKGRKTKGRSTIWEKTSGDYITAERDFYKLSPKNVKTVKTSYGDGKTGILEDGRSVTLRPGSSDGRPTLEIRNVETQRGIEIRYGNK